MQFQITRWPGEGIRPLESASDLESARTLLDQAQDDESVESFSMSDSGKAALRKELFTDLQNYLNAHLIPDFSAMEPMVEMSMPAGAPSYSMRTASAMPKSAPQKGKRKILSSLSQFLKRDEDDAEDNWSADYAEYGTAVCDELSFEAVTGQAAADGDLNDWLEHLDEGFSATLLQLIDAKGMTDAQVYRRANMSRQLFSKIRSNPDYRPKKQTVLALCVALELDTDATEDLLRRAGYALNFSDPADVIVAYFISRNDYDLFRIDAALFSYDCPVLGGKA